MPWLAWWMGETREVQGPETIVEYRPAKVSLPGGKLWMGSAETEKDRRSNEVRHEVEADSDVLSTLAAPAAWPWLLAPGVGRGVYEFRLKARRSVW